MLLVEVERQRLTFLDLFAGIGGFRLGMEALGHKCVGFVEFDKFARKSYEAIHDTKGEWTREDITEVTDEEVRGLGQKGDVDVICGGFPCFSAGTLITTDYGVKPIEDIRTGDFVLTHENVFKPVVVPMKKKKKGIYRLVVQGSPVTHVTEEHPIYVREMYRTYNTVDGKRTNKRNWGEPKWVEAKDLVKGKHFIGMSENKLAINPLDITKEEAWLIGRYVADGYIRNNKRADRENSFHNQVVFCVGKKKIREFHENVHTYYVGVSEEPTIYKCRIMNERLMNLCLQAGRGSGNKEVPGFILDLPRDLLELFLDGYLSGDGSVDKGVYRATSISKKLIYGLGQVVQKVYQTPYSIQFTKRPETTVIEGRTVNQSDTWMISFRKEVRKGNEGVYIDGMLWMPIRSIDYNEKFNDFVYNFEVEDDNSYVANNLTVHNCQAFSVAGHRKGFEDTRGTLFFEIMRFARILKPKFLFLENVKGLVNHDKGKTLDIMVETLNECGYTVDFSVLNSKFFGVPQNRERIFIIAVRDDLVQVEPWKIEGNTVVPKGKKRIGAYEGVKTFNFDWPKQEEVTVLLRDVLEIDVDEKYYLSDDKTAALIAQLEESDKIVGSVGHHPFSKKKEFKGYSSDLSPSLIATDYKAPKTLLEEEQDGLMLLDPKQAKREGSPRVYREIAPTLTSRDYKEPNMVGHLDMKGNDSIKRVYSPEGICPTLTTMGGGHQEPKIAEKIVAEPEVIAGENDLSYCLDANYTKGIAPNGIGKGRRTHVIEEVRPVLTPDRVVKRQNGRRFKEDGEESFTVTAQDRHGIAIREATKKGYAIANEGDAVNLQFPESKTRRGRVGKQIANTLETAANQGVVERSRFSLQRRAEHRRYRIRKLTPRECWRLQGYPDSVFDLARAVNSDSQLYKQAGNSVTVNVIEELARRITLLNPLT